MAKGNFNGILRGKLGNTVFYEIKNSNNSEKQGLRERKRVISNPQTSKQADQRMKLLPATKIAAVLKAIIERGFEGVPYGTRSRQAFMKYALLMTDGFPYVEKDSPIIYPGRYLISRGSLPEVTASWSRDAGVITHLNCSVDILADTTIGELSADLLGANSTIQKGDQLTFIMGAGYEMDDIHNSPVLWVQKSFYLNPDDMTTIEQAGLNVDILFENTAQSLSFTTASADFIAAFGIILSRESSTGAHLRSTCRLEVSSRYDEMFESATKATARKSYMKKNRSLNADWPEVNTDDWEESGGGEIDPVDQYIGTTTFNGIANVAVLRSTMKVIGNLIPDIDTGQASGTLAVFADPESKTLTSVASGNVTTAQAANVAQISTAEATTLRSLGYTIPNEFVGD